MNVHHFNKAIFIIYILWDICMLVAIGDRLVRIDIIIYCSLYRTSIHNFDSPPILSPQKWCTLISPYMQMKHQTRVYFMFSKMRRTVYVCMWVWVSALHIKIYCNILIKGRHGYTIYSIAVEMIFICETFLGVSIYTFYILRGWFWLI